MTILAPSAIATNWTTQRPDRAGAVGLPCIAYDTVWLDLSERIYGFDHLTGKLTYGLTGFGGRATAVRPFEGGLLVHSLDRGKIYMADLDGAAPRAIATYQSRSVWFEAAAGSVYLHNFETGLWRVPPTAENVPPSENGRIIGGIGKASSPSAPVIAPDAVFLARQPNMIDVLDPRTLAIRNTIVIDGVSIGAQVGSACNGPVACFVLNDNIVIAIDDNRRKWSWRIKVNATLTTAIAVDSRYCYVGTVDGRILMFDVLTGAEIRQFRVATKAIASITQDGGFIYATCGDFSGFDEFIYAVDTRTGTVGRHKTGSRPGVVGVESGVVYYFDAKTVGAFRLADLLREFYAESVLVQDFVFASGSTTEKPKPAIHTEITLYDRGGSPWAMQTVRVDSTSPITIESGGKSYTIDATRSADLKTDGGGKLRIDMPAGDVNSKGVFRSGFTSPGLTLFTSFMSADERILVRADAQMQNELGKFTPKRLQEATDYDGKPVVEKEYRENAKVMANVAGMLGATTGMVKESLDNRAMQPAARRKRYLAPGCDMGTICCCETGDYACKVVCNRAFALDLNPARSTFGYLATKEEIERWLRDHPVTPGSVMSSDDFWDAVKRGAAKVKDVIVYAAKQIDEKAGDLVHTVIAAVVDGVLQRVNFIVDTIEHAVTIVHGIFNEIAGGIEKMIETLSLVFNWTHIIELKNEIKTKVEQSFDRLLKPQAPGGKNLLTQARERGDKAFAHLRDNLDGVFADLNRRIGNESGSAVQRKHAGKNNPAKGGATSNWLQSKMHDNLLSEQALDAHSLSAGMDGSAFNIPAFKVPEGLEKDISAFLRDLQGRVTGDVNESIKQLQSSLNTSNSDLFSSTFKFFLALAQGTLKVGLDVVSAVFDGAIRILEKMLDVIWSYIRDQKVTIPFLSDLYRSVAKSDLTGLDLACLLIALPGSVALAAVSGGRRGGLGTARVSGILAGVGQLLWSTVAATLAGFGVALGDVFKANPAMKKIFDLVRAFCIAAFGAGSRGLFLWSDIDANNGNTEALLANTALWAFPTFAVAVDLIGAAVDGFRGSPLVGEITSGLAGVSGVAMAAVIAVFAGANLIKGPLLIVFNGLVALGLIARFAMISEPKTVKVVAITIILGFVFASGVVKLVDAAGVLTTEALMPGAAIAAV